MRFEHYDLLGYGIGGYLSGQSERSVFLIGDGYHTTFSLNVVAATEPEPLPFTIPNVSCRDWVVIYDDEGVCAKFWADDIFIWWVGHAVTVEMIGRECRWIVTKPSYDVIHEEIFFERSEDDT